MSETVNFRFSDRISSVKTLPEVSSCRYRRYCNPVHPPAIGRCRRTQQEPQPAIHGGLGQRRRTILPKFHLAAGDCLEGRVAGVFDCRKRYCESMNLLVPEVLFTFSSINTKRVFKVTRSRSIICVESSGSAILPASKKRQQMRNISGRRRPPPSAP